MVKENSYINIQAFMVNDLHLKGNELLIYAIIFGFSQDEESEFTGSLQYLADWTQSTKQGVMKALQSLCEKQLILKNVEYKNNIRFCTYKSVTVLNKVEQGIKQSLPEYETKFNGGIKQSLPNNIYNTLDNNINNNIVCKNQKKKKENPDYKKVVEQYFNNYKKLYEQKRVNTEKPYFTSISGSAIKNILPKLSVTDVIKILDNAMADNWIVENGYAITTILAESQVNKLLNGRPQNQTSQKLNVYVNNKRPASDNKVGEIDF